ncbi:MAG TPA: ASCH domain-containing protein [Pyrinomonadaceae bacterium]|nr:ASCH domain-containing protein [Pyrinomonadaceae bacterium]
MGLLNFKQRFVPRVLEGSKNHSIRAKRKHPIKVGDTCHLYTGLRTKRARLLGRSPCVKVEDIFISESADIFVDDIQLDPSEKEGLARKDGFDSFAEMAEFWKGRLPFSGDIIHWKPLRSCPQCNVGMVFKGTSNACVPGTHPCDTGFTVDLYECEECGVEVCD